MHTLSGSNHQEILLIQRYKNTALHFIGIFRRERNTLFITSHKLPTMRISDVINKGETWSEYKYIDEFASEIIWSRLPQNRRYWSFVAWITLVNRGTSAQRNRGEIIRSHDSLLQISRRSNISCSLAFFLLNSSAHYLDRKNSRSWVHWSCHKMNPLVYCARCWSSAIIIYTY